MASQFLGRIHNYMIEIANVISKAAFVYYNHCLLDRCLV